MQLQEEIHDLASSLSFDCYFPDSLTATAADKVSREFKAAQFHELSDANEEDFEFSMEHSDEEVPVPTKQIHLEDRKFVFPAFYSELPTKGELDLEVEEIDDASSIRIQVKKLFVDDDEESSSSSSSETYELEDRPSGTFCMWNSKADDVVSSPLTKCKKSSSTGSGLGRWKIRNLLRRCNSEGKESIFLPKKVEASKQKRNINSEKVSNDVAGKLKTASSPSYHELFYVQKRAERRGDNSKTFLPYRQDLLGFFVNINRTGNKKLSF